MRENPGNEVVSELLKCLKIMQMRRVSKKANLSHKTTCSPVLEQEKRQFRSNVCLHSKSEIISQAQMALHLLVSFLRLPSPPLPPSFQFLFPFFLFFNLLIILLPLRSFCEGARLEPREPKSVHWCLYRITEYPSSVVLLQERKPAGLYMFMPKSG